MLRDIAVWQFRILPEQPADRNCPATVQLSATQRADRRATGHEYKHSTYLLMREANGGREHGSISPERSTQAVGSEAS
jgi:hypothetical protein